MYFIFYQLFAIVLTIEKCPLYCFNNGQKTSLKTAKQINKNCLQFNGTYWNCKENKSCFTNAYSIDINKYCDSHSNFICPYKCQTKRGDTMFITDSCKVGLSLWRYKDNKWKCGTPRMNNTYGTKDYIDIRKYCLKESYKKEIKFPLTKKLIFSEEFNEPVINLDKWEFEISAYGGGNWEFQYYDDSTNTTKIFNKTLTILPELTSNVYGDKVISGGSLEFGDKCTNALDWGCKRVSNGDNILNPIHSGKIKTKDFAFKYGKLEASIKLPRGDWLWPALWLLPKREFYGGWPRSGEIDLLESRGNSESYIGGGYHEAYSTLHWGESFQNNQFHQTTAKLVPFPNNTKKLTEEFHIYTLEWYKTGIRTSINGKQILSVPFNHPLTPSVSNFIEKGGFSKSFSPWKNSPTQHAPFDKEFYILINLAVGGTTGFFPDAPGKPWVNQSPVAPRDFLAGKDAWFHGWPKSEKDGFSIDYIRVWSY